MAAFRCLVVLAISLVAVTANAQEAKKKPLAVEDLYLMESVRSPVLFPKEQKLIYERVWIDAKTKTERHSLWLVTGKRENRKPLEKDEPDGRNPAVSPDGEWIAFLSTRQDPPIFPTTGNTKLFRIPSAPPFSDPALDIWLYHVKSAKVIPLGTPGRPWGRVFHDGFYGRVAFSPDSKRLVFVADDGKDLRTREEIENEVEIVRPDQGEGYTGFGTAQVWIAELDDKAEKSGAKKWGRLTDDDVWYGDPNWSPDGKSLVVVANKTNDRESVRYSINKNFDLYLIDVDTKKQTQLTTNPGPDVSPRWSPDGKQIAYLSSPRNGPHRDIMNLSIVALADGVPKTQILFDHHNPNLSAKDNNNPAAFPLPERCWIDDHCLLFNAEVGLHTHLTRVEIQKLRFDITAAKPDAIVQKLLPQLGIFMDRLIASGTGRDLFNEGLRIQTILTLPPAGVSRPPHKVIVYPHGGPHGRYASGLDFTSQLFAAHGYAVLHVNFRGSSGSNKKFLDADRFDLGGGDMRDILKAINLFVKTGDIDPKRQFVYGTSYGGFMTSWLVGHTNQFRAAVMQNAVTDMNMMYGLSDLQSWTTWELGGLPWEQPERYAKHSPLTYANMVKTPTLILHARDDRRCPLPMGKAFHQALLTNDVPTQMVIYPNEGHAIRQPRHREDVYRRVLAWFAKYE
jgi:dipeptidyl aminopeptidase/acylaminoacyl peptidase